jgi:uncharacterized protein YcfJ
MTRLMLTLGAAASALTLSIAQPALADDNAPRHSGKVTYTECRKSDGTTGLAIGGVAGALIGGGIFGGILGPILGGVGGAFAGRAIDRDSTKAKRCRLVREEKTNAYEREESYETSRPNDRYEPSMRSDSYAPARESVPVREEDRDLVQPERS